MKSVNPEPKPDPPIGPRYHVKAITPLPKPGPLPQAQLQPKNPQPKTTRLKSERTEQQKILAARIWTILYWLGYIFCILIIAPKAVQPPKTANFLSSIDNTYRLTFSNQTEPKLLSENQIISKA